MLGGEERTALLTELLGHGHAHVPAAMALCTDDDRRALARACSAVAWSLELVLGDPEWIDICDRDDLVAIAGSLANAVRRDAVSELRAWFETLREPQLYEDSDYVDAFTALRTVVDAADASHYAEWRPAIVRALGTMLRLDPLEQPLARGLRATVELHCTALLRSAD